ncbi:MAG: TadE/TadG family type IV pilus assembly protein, partial [Bradyrhizobium sp.]
MAVMLLLSIGAAIDIGRWLHARDQTQAAIDAALLAGGRSLQVNSTDTGTALAIARKYYAQNVTSRLPVTNDSVNFTVSSDGMSMTAGGTAYIKTPFLQLANIAKLPLLSTAASQFSKSQIAVGGNGGESLEVSMMLDITGSMAGQKIQDLKDSA